MYPARIYRPFRHGELGIISLLDRLAFSGRSLMSPRQAMRTYIYNSPTFTFAVLLADFTTLHHSAPHQQAQCRSYLGFSNPYKKRRGKINALAVYFFGHCYHALCYRIAKLSHQRTTLVHSDCVLRHPLRSR